MKRLISLIALLFVLASGAAHARVLVLVHGYLGSAGSWEASGISQTLQNAGWQRAGILTGSAFGDLTPVSGSANGDKLQYSVQLPSIAPAMVQSDLLQRILDRIRARHPQQPITLLGHSAGGVIARLTLVRFGAGQVDRLITIAAPHLGTVRALEALDYTHGDGPFQMVKDFFGGGLYHTVKDSAGLLLDLAPPAPGNLLGWLNVQPHPDIAYLSLVRGTPLGLAGDAIVPAFSQDMNNVPALRGKAETRLVPAGHELAPVDGLTIAGLLH